MTRYSDDGQTYISQHPFPNPTLWLFYLKMYTIINPVQSTMFPKVFIKIDILIKFIPKKNHSQSFTVIKPFEPLITTLPLVSTESTVLECPSKVCVRISKREVVILSRVPVNVRGTYGRIRPDFLKKEEIFEQRYLFKIKRYIYIVNP